MAMTMPTDLRIEAVRIKYDMALGQLHIKEILSPQSEGHRAAYKKAQEAWQEVVKVITEEARK